MIGLLALLSLAAQDIELTLEQRQKAEAIGAIANCLGFVDHNCVEVTYEQAVSIECPSEDRIYKRQVDSAGRFECVFVEVLDAIVSKPNECHAFDV